MIVQRLTTWCGRCRCCTLGESRRYLNHSLSAPYVVFIGACVGSCHENGHTTESVDAARQVEYERQIPLRRAIRHDRDDAVFEAERALRALDRLYDEAGWA